MSATVPTSAEFSLLDKRVTSLKTVVDGIDTRTNDFKKVTTQDISDLENDLESTKTGFHSLAATVNAGLGKIDTSQSAQDTVIAALEARILALEHLHVIGTLDFTKNDVTVLKKANFELTVNKDMPGAMIALVLRETVPLPLLVVTPPPTQDVISPDSNPVAVLWPLHNTTGGAQISGGIGPYQVTYTPTRGSSFAVGVTQVTIDVTSGDNQTRQGFFLVDVAVAPPPPPNPLVLVNPSDVTAFTPDGNPVAVSFAALATGGLQPYAFTYFEGAVQKFSGNTFALGAHTIDVTVTDSDSPPNVDTDSFTITVLNVGTSHDYFDTLVARGDLFKAYSMRPVPGQPITSPYYANQLLAPVNGGYAHSGGRPLVVLYNPSGDTDTHAQDAAKTVIGPWVGAPSLAQAMSSSTTDAVETIFFTGSINIDNGSALKIGTEIVKINGAQPQGTSMSVKRGQYGTTAAAHSSGATVQMSNNSLTNQWRPPLNTTDGNIYFFTWDVYWTDSYMSCGISNHKAFQLTSNNNGVWLQPNAGYAGSTPKIPGWNPATDVASIDFRCNHVAGPGVTQNDPILPKVGTFRAKPNTWTRYFILLDQQSGADDPMDAWAADETQNAVQLYNDIPLRVAGTPGKISHFWVELNTSVQGFVRGDERDLVAYVRNFVALVNPGDITGLLVKPV